MLTFTSIVKLKMALRFGRLVVLHFRHTYHPHKHRKCMPVLASLGNVNNFSLGAVNSHQRREHRERASASGSGTNIWPGILVAAGVGAVGAGWYFKQRHSRILCAEAVQSKQLDAKYGEPINGLPVYRKKDINAHNNANTGIWVTYRHGVYDITNWVQAHPGGTKILLAAGKQLEPFFNTYAVHKAEHVMEMMEELRIGNLHPDDMKEDINRSLDDPYRLDPIRHPALVVNSEKPFNAETPPSLLPDSYLTPNELFFVRNHLPVPNIDIKQYKLEISGKGIKKPINFTVEQLKKQFKVHSVMSAVQCTGNRRTEMAKEKAVKGLSWTTCAISNAEWTGVKLCDVLEFAGVKEEDIGHVIFQGLDKDMEKVPYEASIPAATACDPRKDVLLVFEMNGETLPPDHGYPVRVMVPGVAGARHVKWLSKVIVSKEESTSHWQQNDYKSFNPSVNWDTVDFSKSVAIQEYPIQSAICEPAEGATLEDSEEVCVKGYAWSGGGRGIIRVDVSIDGGATWVDAKLHSVEQPLHRQYGWSLWETTVPIPKGTRKLDIICKALDTSHNVQPETARGIWNLRGLIHNAWHHVHVDVPEE